MDQNDLLKDPLFQLNTVLWLSQPLPGDNAIKPLLHEQGFSVYALSPLIPMPIDVRLSAQNNGITLNDSVRPDVILHRPADLRFVLLECKASSFGPQSSTSGQARALLVATGNRSAEVLGLRADQVTDSLLSYLVPNSENPKLSQTLSDLSKELSGKSIVSGSYSVFGLMIENNQLGVHIDSIAGQFFSTNTGFNPFMALELDNDPRPLYFIPYDPDLNQSESEKAFCKRVLFERIHSSIIAAIGRAHVPCEISFQNKKLLNDALFGMYDHWDNNDSSKNMKSLCKQLMTAILGAVNSQINGIMTYEQQSGWKISLKDNDQHEKALDALAHFSCESLDLKTEPPPDLFSELEQ